MGKALYIAALATSLLSIGVAQAQQRRHEVPADRYVASASDDVVFHGTPPSDSNAEKVMGLSVPNGFRAPPPRDVDRR